MEEFYSKNDNYYIMDIVPENKNCLIIFSSNGLYVPNTEEAFVEKIIKNDRYEFMKVSRTVKIEKQFGKIIFVRDVWRSWYVRGINQELNSIDKVIEKLKELTAGYSVVTTGISSGGYMAVVTGIKLKAEKVLCFSGQFFLGNSQRNCINIRYENDETRNKYFDIVALVEKTEVPIIYFYPAQCDADKRQAERVIGYSNVVPFAFDYAIHAQTVVPCNFKYLFGMSVEEYRKLSKKLEYKKIKSVVFLLRTGKIEGIIDCFKCVFTIIKKNIVGRK